MTKNPYQILQKPLITEKGLDAKERNRTLVFRVAPDANKAEIKTAVEAVFKVRVDSVLLSVSGGLFLVLETDKPFDGILRISSAPLRNALSRLGE